MSSLSNKVALITGASRGIGRAVAKQLAAEGAHVLLLARSVPDLESLDDEIRASGGSATLIPQDLNKLEMLPSLGSQILSRFGKLDILILNAAILGELMPIVHTDLKLWQEMLQINVTANLVLLQTLDPALRAAPDARVIAVTSGVVRRNLPFWGPYATCKAALEEMIQIYAAEMEHTNVRVELLSPGAVATAMRAKAMPGEDPSTLPQPEDVVCKFLELVH